MRSNCKYLSFFSLITNLNIMINFKKLTLLPGVVAAGLCALCVAAYASEDVRFMLRSPGQPLSVMGFHRLDMPKTAVNAPECGISSMKAQRKVTAPGGMPEAKRADDRLPSLTGLMIYSSAWGFGNGTGIYAIDASNGATTLLHALPEVSGNGTIAGTSADGYFYGSYCEDFYGNINKLVNYRMDLATGKVDSYTYDNPTYDDVSTNMTYDASSRKIYSINYDGSTDYYALTVFDPIENRYTAVGELDEHYYALCSDSRGHIYAVNDLGAVVELNPETAAVVREVAQTNIEPRYSQSCAWSPKDNLIYWAACNDVVAALVTIDPATGAVATATRFPNDEEFVGLSCSDAVENPSAPAAPANLAVTYPVEGGLAAVVSCDAPSLTVGGEPLAGELTLHIYVDDTELTEQKVTAGAKVSHETMLEKGVHRIEVCFSNASGNGTRGRVTTFAGIDSPADVTDLKAVATDPETVRLEWSAPAAGEHGGWFDPSLLSYNVVRGGKVIDEGLTATEYIDRLDDTFATNLYALQVCYNGAVCGSSNQVRVNTGTHLALPYSNSFENAGDFDLLTVLDLNRDGNTWFHDTEYNTASYNFSRDMPGNDILVMPVIEGEKGHVYRMEFFTRSASQSYPDKLAVLCGDEPTASGLPTVLIEGRVIKNEGENLSVEFAPDADGPLYFGFHCVSDKDMSRLFVDDITISDCGKLSDPAPAGNLRLVPDADGALSVKIGFTAPETTLGGAELKSLDRVDIYRNGKLIHTITNPAPGAALDYTDNDAEFGFNLYSVCAVAGGSGVNRAEGRVFAGIYRLPFHIGPTEEEYSLFSIHGGEKDGTWYYDADENALKVTTYGSSLKDAYIFTPAIELTDANLVDLTFEYRAGLASCPEELEVTFGTSPDPSTHQVVERFEFNNTSYASRLISFPVASAGRYYIGFHAVSLPNSMMMLVRNIGLDRGSLMTAPAPVVNMQVTGGDRGALTADVSFSLPVETLDGELLTGTLGARLYRADGTLADTAEGLAPGSQAVLTDTEATHGINTYTVVASNGDGEGGRAEASGWIGVDVPVHIPYLDALPTYDNLRAELSWDAPVKGLHGGYVDPHALKYNVYQLQDNSLYLINTTESNEITVMPQGGNVQDFYTFYVTAVSEAGESQAVSTGLVVGPPYELPMVETASNRIVTALPWISGPLTGDVNWGVADFINSIDVTAADGGMFVCSAALPERRPGSARMQLPKLVFDGLNAPTLTFHMYHYPVTGGSLKVSVTTDELEYNEVFSADVNSLSSGWKEYSVNLAEYADAPWVAIVFDGILANGAAYVIVDDIEVANRSVYDILINRVTGKLSPEAGITHEYAVEVKNNGKEAVDFDLEMRVNGVTESAKSYDNKLAAGKTATLTLPLAVLPEHINNQLDVEIEAIPREWQDEIPANNISRFSLTAIQPDKPVVTDLEARYEENGVRLAWSAPSLVPEPVTDSFTDYESFAYDNFGDYKTVDNDGLIPCGISGVEFPNMGTPMAFQVWEPRAAGVDVDAEIWQPRSGNKCLVAWTALSSYVEPFNDDWLISPLLYVSDAPQELSFYVRRPVGTYGAESFEVLYSTTGDEPEDFTLLKSETVANGIWNKCSYELPAGTRHFAIRYVSRNRFALLFDDLTYTRATGLSEMRTEGFNVYRNGTRIGDTSATGTVFTDPAGNNESYYNVTTVYNTGESAMSNTARLSSGIGDVVLNGGAVRIEGHEGYISVEAPAEAVVTVVSADGKTVYDGYACSRIDLPAGVYVVTVEGISSKVAVR